MKAKHLGSNEKEMLLLPRSGAVTLARCFNAGNERAGLSSSRERRLNSSIVARATRTNTRDCPRTKVRGYIQLPLRGKAGRATILSQYLLASFLSLSLVGDASAQHMGHSSPAKKSGAVMIGFGEHHHRVTTRSALAQKLFDQGMALLYGFNHDEAHSSFKRASELDPQMAMAFWGMALVLGANINLPSIPDREKAAYENIQKALSLASGASQHERDYINALAKRYSADKSADLNRLAVDYKNAMGELMRKYPDDMDAATLYAESMMNLRPWRLWTKDGEPAEGTEEIVAVLESVLKRDPDHIGANHYYIHAVEASRNPERALASASRLGRLAPASGHLVHMPAHIYIQTGDFDRSAKSNSEAALADEAYIRKTGAKGIYPAMYYSHNLHFLLESHNRAGRFLDARRAAARLEANVRRHIAEMDMLEAFLPSSVFVLAYFNKWDEMLRAPAPDARFKTAKAFWHYGRALAFAAKNKLTDADKERSALVEMKNAIPQDAAWGVNNSVRAVLNLALIVIDARMARAKRDFDAAIDAWEKAVEEEDALGYDEPPAWYYPVRQSLGAVLLQAGKAERAEKVFRAALNRAPRNGRLLFGLMESLKAQGKQESAALVQKQFREAWKLADTKLKIEDL
jgi:tetratricopeptide (TPR) repeat protein